MVKPFFITNMFCCRFVAVLGFAGKKHDDYPVASSALIPFGLAVTPTSMKSNDRARAFSMAATKRLLPRLSRRHRPSP